MSRSSDLHLLLSDYERQFGEQDEEARAAFVVAYSKDRLPSQRKQRPPSDDEQQERGEPSAPESR